MPPLAGFSNCSFRSRDDVSRATVALLESLQKYQSPGGARIRLATGTAALFDETAAQLEGFARPLWTVAALLHGRDEGDTALDSLVAPFVRGFANGSKPDHPEYWGSVADIDQRSVEKEIVAFALLAAPKVFYESQTPGTKQNIINWLREINDNPFPPNNWIWFRVMTNLALIQCCGIPRDELWHIVEADLEVLSTFYLEEGWSSDGQWDARPQADYYSGSFAIQFSQLLYVKFAHDLDPERCEQFRQRARAFALDFVLYFDKNGAAIPFGRSLTYRFAFAGFWSAAAFAEVELPEPLNHPGTVKGLLLRHLRWWSTKHDIFNTDGTLNIGFTYPNMYMSEDYNSPQSVYWCMKSFVAIGLPAHHPFWQAEETTLPQEVIPLSKAIKAPRQIVCNSGSHHFLLSSGQYCFWPLKATEAKYGKFAYSSHFGFSVPTGPRIEQLAPDSALALSIDDGESWRLRWKPTQLKWGRAVLRHGGLSEDLPVLMSSWKPWSIFDVTVSTALIPPCSRWPDWHIRVHRIKWSEGTVWPKAVSKLVAVEGGFAIYGRKASDGHPVPTLKDNPSLTAQLPTSDGNPEVAIETQDGCCVFSSAGASGVRCLDVSDTGLVGHSHGSLLKPDANTNLMCQRTVIPTIESEISVAGRGHECTLAVAVFATSATSMEIMNQWLDIPVLTLGADSKLREGGHIQLLDWTNY